jgi:hypothetical protein
MTAGWRAVQDWAGARPGECGAGVVVKILVPMFASDPDNALDLVGQPPVAGGVDGGEEQILGLAVVSRIKQDGSEGDVLDDLPLRGRGCLGRAVLGEFDGARMLAQVEQATELDLPTGEWVK